MRCPRLYSPALLERGATVALSESAARHCVAALRMGPGAAVTLFDGRGGEYAATLVEAGKKHATALVGEHCPDDRESALTVHLAIAVSKGERMEWVVQKATELGATSITPLISERSEVKLRGERADKKQAQWQQIAYSACEQCQRNRPPQINPITPLHELLDSDTSALKLVLHHRSAAALQSYTAPGSVCLLIGPEGGLSDSEISAAQAAGFEPLTLGPRVLRTETAPLAAIAAMQTLWGDF